MAQPISVSTTEAAAGSPTRPASGAPPMLGHDGWGLSGVEGMAAEEGEAELVEGAGPHARGGGAPGRRRDRDGHAIGGESLPQLVGGLPGEGAHHGVVGLGGSVPDAPGHPEGEHPGLARSGTGHDAQCPRRGGPPPRAGARSGRPGPGRRRRPAGRTLGRTRVVPQESRVPGRWAILPDLSAADQCATRTGTIGSVCRC